mmetsp:Transcript_16440/g.53602  ORF Transcript_16440/g.53602 Transcript_16440/m.53602 type:complete len:261 (-) Transcript_16440:47-829(-)|eukprot:scaffold9733_cov108-Isochrysis_galbana.AAC.2
MCCPFRSNTESQSARVAPPVAARLSNRATRLPRIHSPGRSQARVYAIPAVGTRGCEWLMCTAGAVGRAAAQHAPRASSLGICGHKANRSAAAAADWGGKTLTMPRTVASCSSASARASIRTSAPVRHSPGLTPAAGQPRGREQHCLPVARRRQTPGPPTVLWRPFKRAAATDRTARRSLRLMRPSSTVLETRFCDMFTSVSSGMPLALTKKSKRSNSNVAWLGTGTLWNPASIAGRTAASSEATLLCIRRVSRSASYPSA